MDWIWWWLSWLGQWCATWGLVPNVFMDRTMEWASKWYARTRHVLDDYVGFLYDYLLPEWHAVAKFCFEFFPRLRETFEWRYLSLIEIADRLFPRFELLHDTIYFKIQRTFVEWWTRLSYVFENWWARVERVFLTFWEAINAFITGWIVWIVWFLDENDDKIIYIFTEGWRKVWWGIAERFDLLFSLIENWIEGWETFVDDPAQAIWDWFVVRGQELIATWLVKIW